MLELRDYAALRSAKELLPPELLLLVAHLDERNHLQKDSAIEYGRKARRANKDLFPLYPAAETAGNNSLPVVDFVFADTREHYILNRTRFLRLATGDTEMIAYLCRRFPGHLLIADLPYGVQHAPQFGAKPESFSSLFSRALPAWKKALLPGGVAAVSYNTLTFPTIQVSEIARSAGWIPCKIDFCTHFCHEVEQAVVRDVIFLINR